MIAFNYEKHGLNKKLTMNSIGIGILMACLYMILFSGVARVNEESISQRLAKFADYVSQEAAGTGKEGKFTYGTVAIEGWGYDKQAVVSDVSLELWEKALLETSKWSISTARMVVKPDPTKNGHWLFVFAEPFNIIENSQVRTTVSFPSPVTYDFYETVKDGKRVQAHALYVPQQVTFSPASNADAATAPEKPVVITFDAKPLIRAQRLPDSREYEIAYEFRNVRAVSDELESISIGALSSQQTEASGQDNRVAGKYSLRVSDLILVEKDHVSKPYNLQADFAYQGDQPNVALGKLTPDFSNMELDIGQIALSTEDFRFKVSGTLATSTDDPLPYGTLDVKIDHFNKFLASELVPEMARENIMTAVSKVTGYSTEMLVGANDVTFPIKREKNGVLYVGGTTFETLAASVISGLLNAAPIPIEPAPAAGTPPAPKEEAPAAAPVTENPKEENNGI